MDIIGGSMIQFKDISVRTDFGLEFINISFKIEDTFENLSNYRFDLYSSCGVTDKFELIYSNIQNFECNDYTANLLNDEIMHYYKIKATNIITDESIFSEIIPAYKANDDNYSYFLSEIYNTYLTDVIANEEVALFKRKRTGELCECYDDVRGSSRLGDKCTSCFGTGYKEGFYPPIMIKVCFLNAESAQEGMDIKGTFKENSPLSFWTGNYPLIEEGDIIGNISSADKYTVTSWQPSYKNGFLIRQTVQTSRLPGSSIFSKIKL